jgi:hypothetical protein
MRRTRANAAARAGAAVVVVEGAQGVHGIVSRSHTTSNNAIAHGRVGGGSWWHSQHWRMHFRGNRSQTNGIVNGAHQGAIRPAACGGAWRGGMDDFETLHPRNAAGAKHAKANKWWSRGQRRGGRGRDELVGNCHGRRGRRGRRRVIRLRHWNVHGLRHGDVHHCGHNGRGCRRWNRNLRRGGGWQRRSWRSRGGTSTYRGRSRLAAGKLGTRRRTATSGDHP